MLHFCQFKVKKQRTIEAVFKDQEFKKQRNEDLLEATQDPVQARKEKALEDKALEVCLASAVAMEKVARSSYPSRQKRRNEDLLEDESWPQKNSKARKDLSSADESWAPMMDAKQVQI